MWSVGLIVGVAVAASMVTLALGITIAITIERRRYRRYIEQHTAAATTPSDDKKTSDTHEACHLEAGCGIRGVQLQNSSETWVTLPSSDTIDQDLDVIVTTASTPVVVPLAKDPILVERKSFRRTLRGPIRKKHAGRRKLQKKVRLTDVLNSPLSVISEQSDCPFPSPSDTIPAGCPAAKLTSEEDTSVVSPRCSLSALVTENQPSRRVLLETNDIEDTKLATLSNIIPRSISTTSSVSSVPDDPLPPLPLNDVCVNTKFISKHHTTSSVISVGSSELEALATSPAKERKPAAKTQSQALQDFDFDLSCISQSSSPTQSKPYGMQMKGNQGHKVDSNTSLIVAIPAGARSRTIEPAMRRTGSLATGPAGRHSMCGHYEGITDLSTALDLSPCEDFNDPFTTTSLRVDGFTDKDVRLVKPECLAQVQRHSTCSLGSNEGVQRQKRLRRSQLPMIVSAKGQNQYLRILDPNKHSPRSYGPTIPMKQRMVEPMDDRYGKGFICQPRKNSYKNLRQQDPPQLKHETITQSTPSTPESQRNYRWRFDLIAPNTPKLQFPPSPLRSYESPILPSPAYTPANLRPRPWKSQVQGPRDPQVTSQSPTRPRATLLSDTNSEALKVELRKATGTTDLRKSVAVLRSMYSESELRDSKHSLKCHRLTRLDSPHGTVDTQNKDAILRAQKSPQTTPRSDNFRLAPTSPVLLMTPSITVDPGVASSRSSRSIGTTSIWEDVSVRGDSPEPDLPKLTPPKYGLACIGDVTPSPSVTPRARIEDYEDYENFVQSYGKRAVSRQHQTPKPIGLGLRVGNAVVTDTPGSLYDESGFLKADD